MGIVEYNNLDVWLSLILLVVGLQNIAFRVVKKIWEGVMTMRLKDKRVKGGKKKVN